MFKLRYQICFVFACACSVESTLYASQDTIGENGINSAGLTDFNGLPLIGTGIDIGQVEGFRPGKPDYDTDAMCCNDSVKPSGVFVLNMMAGVNQEISPHAIWVAGVMISTATTAPEGRSPPTGVAPGAALYSSAHASTITFTFQPKAAVAAQQVATAADVRAINMSFGMERDSSVMLDGSSHLSQFVDWSAREHDLLYIIGGTQIGLFEIPIPSDDFNGITVAASSKNEEDGVFRNVALTNIYDLDAAGERTSIDIIAPGINLDLTGPNGVFPLPTDNSGNSFAAPHVAGTVALLQQYAKERIDNAVGPHWNVNENARRHEVMKAVLMNSADKIKDDGLLAPVGSFLGMERTVRNQNREATWLNSPAFSNQAIPLDLEMGAGHLNAKRALQQFAPGEQDVVGTGQVPLIGWDYGLVELDNEVHKYVFDQELQADSYVSITLAWDRDVVLEFDNGPTLGAYDEGETFVDFGVTNVDLYLLEAGATDTSNPVWASTSSVMNLEHIFAEIPTTGDYEFWVQLNDPNLFPFANYAVAWWAAAVQSPTAQGDYNGDTVVNSEDYDLWRASFGSTTNLASDGNGNQVIDAADYVVWRDTLGATLGAGSAAVPEPSSVMLLAIAGAFAVRQRNARAH